ncbi:MAG: hypothetical protein J6Z49_01340 [Kiritimatiellae bacterium]|nr:hypothetical protein [Kiritimatiellia bacterium]
MSSIIQTQIGVNAYAPAGADAVNLYGVNGTSALTLPQLVAAVCIRRAAALEARSVAMMNEMTQNNGYMEVMADVVEQIVSGNATFSSRASLPDGYRPRKAPANCTIKQFLTLECGISESALPSEIDTYDRRVQVFTVLRQRMDSANTMSQQDAINLQSLINWRDVTYNMSSGVIAAYGTAATNMATNI